MGVGCDVCLAQIQMEEEFVAKLLRKEIMSKATCIFGIHQDYPENELRNGSIFWSKFM